MLALWLSFSFRWLVALRGDSYNGLFPPRLYSVIFRIDFFRQSLLSVTVWYLKPLDLSRNLIFLKNSFVDNATPVSRLLLIESALEFASLSEVFGCLLLGGLHLDLLVCHLGLSTASWTRRSHLVCLDSCPDAQIFGSGWQRKKGKCDSTALWSYAPAHALWVAFCSRSGPTDRRVVLFTIRPH